MKSFFQVFDKGWMEDGEGRYIDFHNTIILLTTNVGTDLIAGMCKDPELLPDPEGISKALREPLLKVFPPALLGRITVIPYYPLSDEVLKQDHPSPIGAYSEASSAKPQSSLRISMMPLSIWWLAAARKLRVVDVWWTLFHAYACCPR
jgi:hypothetical protein